jgi:hypothetical protein
MRTYPRRLTHRAARTCTRCRPQDRERGSVTAFVVVMATAFVMAAGLVVDGGLALAAKITALDEAQQAARTAATALAQGPLRNGQLALNPGPAIADAQAYIAATGDIGTVTLDGDQIHAHIVHQQHTQILGLFGLGEITVTGDATAQIEQGVNTPDDAEGP